MSDILEAMNRSLALAWKAHDAMERRALAAETERDNLRVLVELASNDLDATCGRAIGHLQRLEEAQEAAETYHEAWQDAAVYWLDKVRRLKEENQRFREMLEDTSAIRHTEHDC